MHTCNLHRNAHRMKHSSGMRIDSSAALFLGLKPVCMHMYVCTYVCLYVYMHAEASNSAHTYTHACMHACKQTNKHTYLTYFTYIHA